MKKFYGVLFMTAMTFGFMACGNSNTSATDQVENEVAEIAEPADTTEVDTSAVVTRGGSESEGFGRCWESGCHCKAFKGRGNTCENCGHAYSRH